MTHRSLLTPETSLNEARALRARMSLSATVDKLPGNNGGKRGAKRGALVGRAPLSRGRGNEWGSGRTLSITTGLVKRGSSISPPLSTEAARAALQLGLRVSLPQDLLLLDRIEAWL
eukprot:COSAG01_NODE_5674_length_4107_cov_23.811876_6_plen_116_part_00